MQKQCRCPFRRQLCQDPVSFQLIIDFGSHFLCLLFPLHQMQQ